MYKRQVRGTRRCNTHATTRCNTLQLLQETLAATLCDVPGTRCCNTHTTARCNTLQLLLKLAATLTVINFTHAANPVYRKQTLLLVLLVTITAQCKGDVRRSIKLANYVCQQKSVICHAKIGRLCQAIKSFDFIVQRRTRSILDDKIGKLFGYRSPWSWLTVGDEYLFYLFTSLLLHNVYFRSLDAEKEIMQVSFLQFPFCCCVFVKLADIVQSCKR